MLTQKIIRQEIDELKGIMGSDSLVIPSIWECAKPGVLILLWLFIWPLVSFGLFGETTADTFISVGFSSFLGLIILFWVVSARGLILSIPKSFLKRSEVMFFLQNKIKKYTMFYMLTISVLSLLCAFVTGAALGYLIPMMFVSIGFVFFFNADVSRYQLSAFTEIVKAFKAQ